MFAPPPPYFDSPAFANMHNPLFDAYIYFDQPETIHGFLFPFLLSAMAMLAYRKSWTWEVTVALIAAMSVAWTTAYMGHTGLHTFPVEVFFLGVLTWRRSASGKEPFPLMLGYAFAYYTALSSDVIHGLLHPADGLWVTWYYGIGGAGFHDGLFIAPIFGSFAVLLTRFGKWLSIQLNDFNAHWEKWMARVRSFSASSQSGFTLIELMIVIAIIGILAAIAIPQYAQYIEDPKAQVVAADFREAVDATTAAVAAAQTGQVTNVYLTLQGSTFMDGATHGDAVYENAPAFVVGAAAVCGQISLSAATISPVGGSPYLVRADDSGCPGHIGSMIAAALSGEGFPHAVTTGVTITKNGRVTP